MSKGKEKGNTKNPPTKDKESFCAFCLHLGQTHTHAHALTHMCTYSYPKGQLFVKVPDAPWTLLEMVWFLPQVGLILSG